MERRVLPIAHSGDQTVLDGIKMDVVDVLLEIFLVPDCMLSKSPLPERIFSISVAQDWRTRLGDGGCKPTFD